MSKKIPARYVISGFETAFLIVGVMYFWRIFTLGCIAVALFPFLGIELSEVHITEKLKYIYFLPIYPFLMFVLLQRLKLKRSIPYLKSQLIKKTKCGMQSLKQLDWSDLSMRWYSTWDDILDAEIYDKEMASYAKIDGKWVDLDTLEVKHHYQIVDNPWDMG